LRNGNGSGGVGRDRSPRAQLPLLDRLLDADPQAPETQATSAHEALAQLRAAVLRDLQALLNARRRRVPLPAELTELPSSLLGYGIPDPASGAYLVPEMRAALAAEVENTIRIFEPRLTRVTVSLRSDDPGLSSMLRLKVDGVLRAEPVPEPVSFETLLEPVSRDVIVREG
jgi:type VI secretion system protein ImpF